MWRGDYIQHTVGHTPTTYQYRNRVTRRYFDVIGTDVVVPVQLQRSSDEGWTWKDCSPTLSVPSEM